MEPGAAAGIGGRLPALRRMLRAVGCQDTMPTLLEWPSSTTTGSDRGVSSPFSGICQTWIRQNKLTIRVKGTNDPVRADGNGQLLRR